MGLFSFIKGKPSTPNRKTLGQWLWNNDSELARQTLTSMTIQLMIALEKQITTLPSASGLTDDERGFVVGHTVQLLDGGSLLPAYKMKPLSPAMLGAAQELQRNVISEGPSNPAFGVALTAAHLIAVCAWYAGDFRDAINVANYLIEIFPQDAEAYRMRGFAHFALGDYERAREDLEAAYDIEPGLNGLFEPLQAARRLTGHPTEPASAKPQSHGVRDFHAALITLSEMFESGATKQGSGAISNPYHQDALRCRALADASLKWGEKIRGDKVASLVECTQLGLKFAEENLLHKTQWPAAPFPTKKRVVSALAELNLIVAMFAGMNQGTLSKELLDDMIAASDRVVSGLGVEGGGAIGRPSLI